MSRSSSQADSVVAVRPFIKWAGGKGQLLPQLTQRLPHTFGRYHEPFVGGAALFFHLHNTGRLHYGAALSDYNPELIGCYQVVRDHVEDLIELLRQHEQHRLSREYFLDLRRLDREPDFYQTHNQIERVARTLFLNRTCYNGLYRLNRKGQFNAPFGSYKNPNVCDADNLHAASIALQQVELRQADFSAVLEVARPGDLVYFDPPYVPLSTTAAFTTYTGHIFGPDDQRRLAGVVQQLAERGVQVLLSNSDTPFSREIYHAPGLHHDTVLASRRINCNGHKRGNVEELIVRSYGVELQASELANK